MQLMRFFHAIKNSKDPKVNEEPILSFDWEDDGEDELAIRVKTESDEILVYATDKIEKDPSTNTVTVSVGATDYQFAL